MIRPADASEVEAIGALVRDAYGRWVGARRTQPDEGRLRPAHRRWPAGVELLDVEGKVVGLVVLKDGPKALRIRNVAVTPAEQGRGHGRRLIAFAEAEAR